MPRFDGTGPVGQGSKTGRGGYCNCDKLESICSGRGFGRGRGRGSRCFGRGFRGRGFCWYTAQTNDDFDEKDLFEKERAALEERLKFLNEKINELNGIEK